MLQILIALLPDFALIGLGAALRGAVPQAAWAGIDRVNYLVLFPALIFLAALGRTPDGADLLVLGIGVWSIMGLGLILTWLVRPLGPERFLDFAGMWQCSWRFNTALGFVAIQGFPPDYRGLLSIAVGLAIPVANLLAVAGLSRGNAMSARRTAWQIATNPFLLASLSGLGLSLLGYRPPELLLAPVARLSDAAVPVAMLSIGAALHWAALSRLDAFKIAISVIRLLILPAATWAVTWAIGLDPARTAVLMVFAALPTASASHVLASVFGANREEVAVVIAQTTFFGMLTLPLWLMLVGSSG
ncbi:AEC family transporter [Pseudooceanicola aestuarii]|uniref:AEC family transporter n=1 Tax=Pseudooceanicola aestuarii TaxID=2697319 RepID=UPI0013D1C0A0|nr:AEC family transporter [Pseudooceanicola aestuarii]